MQQVQRTREKQVTETNRAEEFSAEVRSVGEEDFSVQLRVKKFLAEAVEGRDGKDISFTEEEDVEEFSVEFVEEQYAEFLPSAWEVIQESLPAQSLTAHTAWLPGIPETAEEREPVSVPVIQPGAELHTGRESPVLHRTYETVEPQTGQRISYSKAVGRHLEPQEDTVPAKTPVQYPEDFQAAAEQQDQVPLTAGDQLHGKQENAVKVVQQMFRETEMEGTVERAEEYGVTEDFDSDTPEAYWLDIEGMDMERTEYFINGELAEDAINAYTLSPGDTITFVESDIFYSEPGEASYCSPNGELRLGDILEGDAEAVESYTVSPEAGIENPVYPVAS